ncbi:hypothetical protein XH80_02840, partial [Bradyrhizobium sp. CCBAU 45384]|nr:hypothetical protein [Bradyrhizobium sp. CCBAU 45384]
MSSLARFWMSYSAPERLLRPLGIENPKKSIWRLYLGALGTKVLFDETREVAAWHSVEDCVTAIERYLCDGSARAEIARTGQQRTMGSHEHGDGMVRSEFHEVMFGERLVADFRELKKRFDPEGVLNPGKIVDAPKMDDRSLFRFKSDYRVKELKTKLDWSAYPGAGGGFQGAVEMCNNNGACRKLEGGVMCPSYRATRNEKDATRGRANSLRLAISGQLGLDALASDEMMETLKLCVSCKACRHECPVGVDMAKMKIEALAARAASHGLTLRDRLVSYLPRYAGLAARFAPLANLRNHSPLLRKLFERFAGISARRSLPAFRSDVFVPPAESVGPETGREVVLFADTFNRIYERENLDAALRVLTAGGYRVHMPKPPSG